MRARDRPSPRLPPSGAMKRGALLLASRLCEALRDADDAMVAALLQEGADPNLILPEGVAGMHLAAGGVERDSGIQRLSLLLRHGGDPNVRSGEGLTPVHVAASWGCATCLRLLLAEGGDPHLEDQDGNTAIDLAAEQGSERCVCILRAEGRSSWLSQRRAESFLSTLTEEDGETGPTSRLGDSRPCPSGGRPPSSLKEAARPREPRGAFSQPGGAAPSCQDRSAASFLTECSWQDLSDVCVRPAASANTLPPSSQLTSSPAEEEICWWGEVARSAREGDAGGNRSGDTQSAAKGGGCSSPPSPDVALLGNPSLDSRTLFFRGRPKTPPSPSLGMNSEAEMGQVRNPQDACACNLPQWAEATPPDHVHGFSWAVPDSEKTVVDAASLLRASRTLDGGLKGRRSLSGCSATSIDQYASCLSECYTSTLEGPGFSHVQKQEGRKAAFGCSPGGSSVSNGGVSSGLPACSSEECAEAALQTGKSTLPSRPEGPWLLQEGAARAAARRRDLLLLHARKREGPEDPWEALQSGGRPAVDSPELTVATADSEARLAGSALVPGGPVEIQGLPAEGQGTAPSDAREELGQVGETATLPRLDLPASTQDVEDGKRSSFTQDTLPVQRTLDGRDCFDGSGGPDPLEVGSSTGDAEEALRPIVGGEAPSGLDAKLRSMMLATKVSRSPALQPRRRRCPATPQPQSPTLCPLPHGSIGSSSLFDEALEMPQRPRRVRAPQGLGPASDRGVAAAVTLGHPPPPAREADERLDEGRLTPAAPGSSEPALSPRPGPLGHSLASSRRDIGGDKGPSGGTSLLTDWGEKKPSPWDGWTSGAVSGTAEAGHLEVLRARGCAGKGAQKPSRVSFSRLSARGPSAAAPPGKPSPIGWGIPLSPGGRPANLGAKEPMEYLYVDEDEGHTLIERHIPPTDDSSEDTVLYDWQAYARGAVGGQGDGGSAPLEPGYLSDEALARKLRNFGVSPGPVTALTRKVYVKLLEKLSRDPKTQAQKGSPAHSLELASALETYRIPDCKGDEMALAGQFDQPDPRRKWREGLLKSSFNYLLLDPRVTQNLPFRCHCLSRVECFRTFVSAIFYVGKGKRSRPYCHLYEALTHHREGRRKQGVQASSKVQHILEIWASGQGVISTHCFQNVIPVEAYTREACMMDAIGLKMLTNQKKGNYYGTVAGWPMKRRRSLGVYLLHRALQIFLAEGERQLRPADI